MEIEIEQKKKIENSSPLYPYNGRSLNLIDKFYIFGYNYLTLKKYLIDEFPKIPEENLPINTLIPFSQAALEAQTS